MRSVEDVREEYQPVLLLHDTRWSYKGLLFADMDLTKAFDGEIRPPKGFHAGFMGMIWIDENGAWHFKGRIKFPSGNKIVITRDYSSEEAEALGVEGIIREFCTDKFINKKWYKNPTEDIDGIRKILEDADMIEWERKEPL